MKALAVVLLALVWAAPASAARHHHHRAPVVWPALPVEPWPHWGNDAIGDCAFAAAADWELMTRGSVHASEAQLIQEFHEAGGSDTQGLQPDAFGAYWLAHGIAGVHARLVTHAPSEVQALLRAHTPVIAEMQLTAGETLEPMPFRAGKALIIEGPITIAATTAHYALVAGVNTTGPQIVSWGIGLQLTWAQWNATALSTFLPIGA